MIDIARINSQNTDLDCTFVKDCRNLALGIELGAEIEISLLSIAAEILLKEYVPLQLKYASNNALHYSCYVHPSTNGRE